jgi:hypothetical protein
VPAISHCSLHEFPVTRKTRPQKTCGKDAFIAGLLTWSIRVPSREQLIEVLGQPDPMAGYRLLILTVTRNPDREG